MPGAGFDIDPTPRQSLPPPGRLTGTGAALALDPAQNNAFRAINRAWKDGADVQFANGRYIVTNLSSAEQQELVKTLALSAERDGDWWAAPMHQPRIGLVQPWTSSMDEGWTRWLLEQYGFEPVILHPEDFKSPLARRSTS